MLRKFPTSHVLILIIAIALLAAACSSSHKAGHSTTSSAGNLFPFSGGGVTTTSTPTGGSWSTYYGNFARSGVDTSSPSASASTQAWKSPITANVYAQPIIANGEVIIADENDTVTAFDANSGKVKWSRNLGQPVAGTSLPCGNINPSGITGTPVANIASGKLWVVAFLSGAPSAAQSGPASGNSSTGSSTSTTSTSTPSTSTSTSTATAPTVTYAPYHELFTLSLASGTILSQQSADPSGQDPTVEQQRGALTFANGFVYVPYGGLFGDCGNFHGFLVGIPVNSNLPYVVFQTPAPSQAGIWDPAGPVVVGGGDLLVASGNSSSTGTFDGGNTVTLLSQLLGTISTFTPSDSLTLNRSDLDLGSTNPVAIGNAHFFIAGKEGVGYILNSTNLGGIGGQLSEGQVCSSGAIGGAIYLKSYIYVSCANNLVALKVSGTTFSVAWTSPVGHPGPPIISGGDLWYVDTSNGTLNSYDPVSGAYVIDFEIGTAVTFTSPAAANGKLFVAAGGFLYCYSE